MTACTVVSGTAVTLYRSAGEYVGFIPAINTQESEVNVEAWIENRPQTGAPRPGGKTRPATTFEVVLAHLHASSLHSQVLSKLSSTGGLLGV